MSCPIPVESSDWSATGKTIQVKLELVYDSLLEFSQSEAVYAAR